MYFFRLFGRFEAYYDQVLLTGFEPRKVQELFCYLLAFRHRSHPRELVTELLWQGYPANSTKKNMRQTLWQLQSALNDAAPDIPVVLADGDFLRINPDVDITIDIADFEDACAMIQDIPGASLALSQAETLVQVIALYRANFLEGWYCDWCLHERERLHNLFLMMLDKLILFYSAREEYEAAIQYCNHALREEYNRECTHYQLIRLYYLRGDRTAALRQYRLCEENLMSSLGVQPGQDLIALHTSICADDRAAVLQGMRSETVSLSNHPDLPDVLQSLKQVQAMVEQMQSLVLRSLNVDPSQG